MKFRIVAVRIEKSRRDGAIRSTLASYARRLVIALASLAFGCGDGDSGQDGDDTPAAVIIVAGDDQTAEVGAAVPIDPVAKVTNAAGAPLEGAEVTFVITAGGGSVGESRVVTDDQGEATPGTWTLGPDAGANALSAVTSGLSTTFTAIGTAPPPTSGDEPAAIGILEGNDQTGALTMDLPINPRVVVVDGDGDPVPDVTVTFTPLAGSGTVGSASATTDDNGEAATTWALGRTGTNLMEAATESLTQTFFAIGSDSDYEIEVVFLNPSTTIRQKSAFGLAAGRWMEVVTGDLTDVNFHRGIGATVCGVNDPDNTLQGVQDDLLIYASLVPIDGLGGVLGSAGPCIVRSGVPDAPLTVVGVMQFDILDLGLLERSGTLDDVILHEMGHVLGFGTLWSQDPLDFLQNPSFPNNSGADTHFNGPNAIAALDALPGGPWIPPTEAASKVPVENTEGTGGTRDSHWRESTFVTELMTGFIGSDSNPMSTVTIESLRDLGYEVDITKADPYSLEGENGAAARKARFLLLEDVLRMPISVIDPAGNIVGVIYP